MLYIRCGRTRGVLPVIRKDKNNRFLTIVIYEHSPDFRKLTKHVNKYVKSFKKKKNYIVFKYFDFKNAIIFVPIVRFKIIKFLKGHEAKKREGKIFS